jgi:Trehalose and maltose hydrolases (possible phosphorylases)
LEKIHKIYVPQSNAQGVIPEDDQYLNKKKIDVTRYQNNNQVSDIFKDYNLSQINNLQVTKQADVLLLIYLFENSFSKAIMRSNWHYYEPKTTHDSTLSLSTHAVLACDLGYDEQSYDFYERACETDLGVHIGKSMQGLHLAACGGVWNMTIEGYGGVRIDNGKLRIEPHLPKTWKNLEYQINWHGSLVKVKASKEETIVAVVGNGIEFTNHGREYQVPANSKINVEIPIEIRG